MIYQKWFFLNLLTYYLNLLVGIYQIKISLKNLEVCSLDNPNVQISMQEKDLQILKN